MKRFSRCFSRCKKIPIGMFILLISVLVISSTVLYFVDLRTEIARLKQSEVKTAEYLSHTLEKALNEKIRDVEFLAKLLNSIAPNEKEAEQLLSEFIEPDLKVDPEARIYIVGKDGEVLQEYVSANNGGDNEEYIRNLVISQTNDLTGKGAVVEFLRCDEIISDFEENFWMVLKSPIYNADERIGTIFLVYSRDWLKHLFETFAGNTEAVYWAFSKGSRIFFDNLYGDPVVSVHMESENLPKADQIQWIDGEGLWTLSTSESLEDTTNSGLVGILTLYSDENFKQLKTAVFGRLLIHDIAILVVIILGWWMTVVQIEKSMMIKVKKQPGITEDPVTGLLERKEFLKSLDYMIEVSERKNKKVALIFLDIDDFTSVNQVLGPVLADNVLKSFGKRLKEILRKEDIIGRVGGDEFGIIAAISEKEDVVKLIDKIAAAAKSPIEMGNLKLFLNITSGIAVFPDDGCSTDVLVNKAYEALRIAKTSDSKKRYRFFGVSNG